jgi:hypothetical protein
MPYQCDSNDGNPPIIVIQQLVGDAESLAWCVECWPVFIATSYQAMYAADAPVAPLADDTIECSVCGQYVAFGEWDDHAIAHQSDDESDEDEHHDQAQPGPVAPGPAVEPAPEVEPAESGPVGEPAPF